MKNAIRFVVSQTMWHKVNGSGVANKYDAFLRQRRVFYPKAEEVKEMELKILSK